MSQSRSQARRSSRRTNKEAQGNSRQAPRDKFVSNQQDEVESEFCSQPALPRFSPANDRQRDALGYMQDGIPLVFLRGSAGVGKSMLAAYHAARMLKQKKIEKIYLLRANVHMGKTLGMLKGTLEEKLSVFFTQTIAHLSYFAGKSFVKYCLDKKVIEMIAPEYIRGMSAENCIIIVEEAQNFTVEEFETILTRLGTGAQFIFTGDERQHDLKGESGLTTTLEYIQRIVELQPDYLADEDLEELSDGVAVVTFTPDDCMRGGLTKALVKMYYYK